jgi:hypothetical protein
MIKSRIWLAALGALTLALRLAAQPATAVDTLYMENFRQGVSQSVSVLWLKADGTYEALSNDNRSVSNSVATQLGTLITGKGSYTYTASPSDHTATLVLGSTTRQLQFSTATTGSVAPTFPASANFELLPRVTNPRSNISLRGRVQAGTGPIAGLVITSPQWVLLRVVGPGLAKFGVTSPASQPTLTLTENGSTRLIRVTGWDTPNHEAETTFQIVGAFPLDRGSNDTAILVRLASGNHTLQALSNGSDGEVLIEAYYMPFNY